MIVLYIFSPDVDLTKINLVASVFNVAGASATIPTRGKVWGTVYS
jgi:hypothetical protein